MRSGRRAGVGVLVAWALAAAAGAAQAQVNSRVYQGMRWRMIGPHRGGRTVAGVGVPERPNLFYIGINNGGVWKTTDYGRTWVPVFDDQATGSIGAIAVAPSDPDVIYVGSGEGLQRPDLSTGDGMYKSTDGGATWTHLGLRDGQQIPMIAVDPRTPDRLFVAVLGHPYGPNTERGIFRSTDGGKTFEKMLYKDENTGGMDVALDPSNPDIVYAVLWAARQAPWEIGGSWTLSGNNGLYKSTDGGTTWRPLTNGLPGAAEGLGRIGIDITRGDPRRLYAIVGAQQHPGLYRSDDAGEHWTLVNADPRVWGRDGDFNEVRADPQRPDVVYVANVVTWKSTDGGRTFTGFRGAPGGDDYHRVWINPKDSNVILLTADQGAVITVNGGASWSSWYNQPTAQLYHVTTDNAFPYRVCGGQQESGSVCIASRSNDGAITFRDWHPVGVEEYGYVAPDPLDPDIVYGGKVTRYDRRTGQVQDVSPPARGMEYRVVRTQPLLFSPVDPHTLYFASNVLWKTTDGGRVWTQLSPDLTRTNSPTPTNLGAFARLDPEHGAHRGVIYTIAPSPLNANALWVGTDDGVIQMTTDGGTTWRNVTPPELVPWAKVSIMEASHFDEATAYAAVNTFRLDDLTPHIYRTRNRGVTWTAITTGIPDGAIVNVVREDPVRRGLLFAGTERDVYVSFDDGDHWQSLRLNMPATSIRDLVVKDDDLVIGTHGRSIWILDDIGPLREAKATTAQQAAVLFRPTPAWRVRWNMNTDTPLPPDEPAGENPPPGAVIDYYLGARASQAVTLEIFDAAGHLVRRFSSDDAPPSPIPGRNIPDYWIRPPEMLSAAAGGHRFVWDLRFPPPAVRRMGYPIAAVAHNTPQVPRGPWVMPGTYTIRLTANGTADSQPLLVRMDPRVRVSTGALAQQFQLSQQVVQLLARSFTALSEATAVRTQLTERVDRASAGLKKDLSSFDAKVAALGEGAGDSGSAATDNLARLNDQLAELYDQLQDADAAPTPQVVAGITDRRQALNALLARWAELVSKDLESLNGKLRREDLEPIRVRP